MKKWNRRGFLAGLTSGIAGLGLSRLGGATPDGAGPEEIKIRRYNAFGNTGLKVSDIICGTANVVSANTLSYAYDLGVNTFDTAEGYMRGKSEEFVGQALGKVRDKVNIITKHYYPPGKPVKKQAIIDRFHKSLKRMNTDYVDIAFLHELSDPNFIKNQELLEAYAQLRKEGKLRFTGFSTHSKVSEMLKSCNTPEFLEFARVVLFSYNHMEGHKIEPLIAALHKKGVGTIAMKTLAGGKQGKLKPFVKGKVSYPQAALAWVLKNPNVDCAAITMSTFNHVEEFVGASGTTLTPEKTALLKHYRRETDKHYCRFDCNACETVCPGQVAISDVMRYKMYFEDYGREKQAIQSYAGLTGPQKPLACASCPGHCNGTCPHGLKVKETLTEAHHILTV